MARSEFLPGPSKPGVVGSSPTGHAGSPRKSEGGAGSTGATQDHRSPHDVPTRCSAKLNGRAAPVRYGLLVSRTAQDVANIRERLERRSTPEPNTGCWLWLGAVTAEGYGKVGLGPVNGAPKFVAYAHRVAFELENGPIPEGLTIDHRCRMPGCINAAHMEAVTLQQNCARRPLASYWASRLPKRRAA